VFSAICLLQTVACVLHLGNITFADGHDDEAVPSNDASRVALGHVARLLNVSPTPPAPLSLQGIALCSFRGELTF